MYNSRQKKAFIETVKAETTKKRIQIMFDAIASYEEAHDTDICNVDVKLYPEILMCCYPQQRFETFYLHYRALINYRALCIVRKLIDQVEFFSNDGNTTELKERQDILENLYDFFEDRNNSVKIRTPGECLEVFQKKVFPDCGASKTSLSPDEYKMGYIILRYLGLDDDRMAMVTTDEVLALAKFDQFKVDGAIIGVYDKKVKEFLLRIATVRKIETPYKLRVRFTNLSHKYFLAQEEDVTAQLRKDRIKKIRNTINKKISMDGIKNVPSLPDISFYGTIYRMCIGEHAINQDVTLKYIPDEYWIPLYNSYANLEKNKREFSKEDSRFGAKGVEIKRCFAKECVFLEQNNEWPH